MVVPVSPRTELGSDATHASLSSSPVKSSSPEADAAASRRGAATLTPGPDPAVIARWLRLLVGPGQVVELRGLRKDGHVDAGLFTADHIDDMARRACALSDAGDYRGLYFTLNCLKPELMERAQNTIASNVKSTASAADILARRWLLVDVDPSRPSNCSATVAEKARAEAKATEVRAYLRNRDWPDPVLADSGNGFHLLYRIDLAVEDGGLVQGVLHALAHHFDDAAVQVDTAVHDPARITRLYGTVARKGHDTPERPHRPSAVLEVPDTITAVPRPLLEVLAASFPRMTSSAGVGLPELAARSWPPVAPDDLPAEILIPRLRGVRKSGPGRWTACCPGHPDRRPSLSISETEDFTLLVCCHAGCDVRVVLAAVDLGLEHLYASDEAVYKAIMEGKRQLGSLTSRRMNQPEHTVEVAEGVVRALTDRARACYFEAVQNNRLQALATELGLPTRALADFGVGCGSSKGRAIWTFPERDGKGRVVGLLNRDGLDGSKQCDAGSYRGIVFSFTPPPSVSDPIAPLYLPEGHSDTIALHGAGCLAIGRPMARLSGPARSWLLQFLLAHPRLWKDRPVVVVGDNDATGRHGAEEAAATLAQALGKAVSWHTPPPPHGDIREWVKSGTFTPGWPVTGKTE